MKKLLSMLLIGVLLMGIGGAVCVFEFSGYTYITSPSGELFAPSTTSLSVRTPSEDGTIYFESYDNQPAVIAVDESLSDNTLRVEVYGPNQLFKYHITPDHNTLYFYYETDPFKVVSAFLDSMKDKEFISIYDADFDLTVYASSTTAKRVVVGPDPARAQNRSRMEEMRSEYELRIQDLRTQYDDQLADLRANYEEQLFTQRESYEERLQTQQENYEERLQTQKESYEQRLEDMRNQ